jgi:hypothetical protein
MSLATHDALYAATTKTRRKTAKAFVGTHNVSSHLPISTEESMTHGRAECPDQVVACIGCGQPDLAPTISPAWITIQDATSSRFHYSRWTIAYAQPTSYNTISMHPSAVFPACAAVSQPFAGMEGCIVMKTANQTGRSTK